jgi:hypothetical protein
MYSFNKDLPSLGQVCTEEYPYCIGVDCKKLSGTPWLNRGMDAVEYASYMSWVPLVKFRGLGGCILSFGLIAHCSDEFTCRILRADQIFGSISVVLGGVVSDRLAKSGGPKARILVALVSNAVAAPLCACNIFLPSPWCFVSQGLGYVVGEMWIGCALMAFFIGSSLVI